MKIKIRNKLESLEFIKNNSLNYFGEEVFKSNQIAEIKNYLDSHTEKYFILKDKTKISGKVYLNLTREEVLEHINEYNILGLDVASYNYLENKILLGEILITSKMEVILSGSFNKESSHRNFCEPNIFLKSDIFDRKIKYIKGLEEVMSYIFEHHLFDIIIEFCVYDIPLGIYKENVVIFEVRTDY